MTNARDHWRRAAGRAFVSLAFVALVLGILAPPGFMPVDDGSSTGLVICTGHGPLIIGGHADPKAPPHRSADAPCAFAGSATPPAPPAFAFVPEQGAGLGESVMLAWSADLAPGRGLAAPPPRSRAPPASPKTI